MTQTTLNGFIGIVDDELEILSYTPPRARVLPEQPSVKVEPLPDDLSPNEDLSDISVDEQPMAAGDVGHSEDEADVEMSDVEVPVKRKRITRMDKKIKPFNTPRPHAISCRRPFHAKLVKNKVFSLDPTGKVLSGYKPLSKKKTARDGTEYFNLKLNIKCDVSDVLRIHEGVMRLLKDRRCCSYTNPDYLSYIADSNEKLFKFIICFGFEDKHGYKYFDSEDREVWQCTSAKAALTIMNLRMVCKKYSSMIKFLPDDYSTSYNALWTWM